MDVIHFTHGAADPMLFPGIRGERRLAQWKQHRPRQPKAAVTVGAIRTLRAFAEGCLRRGRRGPPGSPEFGEGIQGVLADSCHSLNSSHRD
jgi:hypothetical protein